MESSPQHQPSGQYVIKRTSGLILLALLLIVPIAWGVLSYTAAPREVGREFVNALREGDYDRAFELCSPDLREHLGSSKELGHRTKPKSLPRSWWWTSSEVRGDTARLSSSTRTWWNRSSVSVTLYKIGDKWRVGRMSAGTTDGRMKIAVPRQ